MSNIEAMAKVPICCASLKTFFTNSEWLYSLCFIDILVLMVKMLAVVFWVVPPCSHVGGEQGLGGTLVPICQTTQHHSPEYCSQQTALFHSFRAAVTVDLIPLETHCEWRNSVAENAVFRRNCVTEVELCYRGWQ